MIALLIRITIALGVALFAAVIAKRASAATRHLILVTGQLAALTIPLLSFITPAISVTWTEHREIRRSAPALHAPVSVPMDDGFAPIAPEPPKANVLAIIWLSGAALVLARRVGSLVHARRLIARARRWNDVYLSTELQQPVTLGRRIVLPDDALQWDPVRTDSVLLHERAHVARRDSLSGLITDAVCVAYWFHPLVWVVAARAALERERACDEAVLASGIRRIDYAGVLLLTARGITHPKAALAMAGPSHLESRIKAILDGDFRRPGRTARTMILVAAVVSIPVVAALAPVAIIRPSGGEPDLLGDAIASPYSERIGAPEVKVDAAGPDALLIERMQRLAGRPPKSEIDFVADRARWALGRVRDGKLVEPLLESLRNDDWRVRAYAAWALGVTRDPRATVALVPFLEDPVWRMRAMAAWALSKIADPAARPAMQRSLGDPAWQVRVCVVHYFAAFHDSAVLAAMRDDRHVAVRDAAGGQ